jgi:hypothetical protein
MCEEYNHVDKISITFIDAKCLKNKLTLCFFDVQYYGNLGRYMCIDFIDLNKVFSKDNFSLSKIDRLLDSMASFEFLSLPNANLGYHEILVHPDDEEK